MLTIGRKSPRRPCQWTHAGYGGEYMADRLGLPESKFNPSTKRNHYFVPMTGNEVTNIDGKWWFNNPALPPIDSDGKARATVKDTTK